MGSSFSSLFASRSRWFDLGVLAGGLVVLCCGLVSLAQHGVSAPAVELVTVPLIMVIARFPMVLDSGGRASRWASTPAC